MELLPIDVSERLYERYSATLMDPEPLSQEMRDVSSNFRATYEKGIVVTREQLFWIWNAHKKNADLSEPYDVGVLNMLALVLDICCDKDPVFTFKPESRRSVIKAHKKRFKARDKAVSALQERLIDEQKIYSEKLAAMTATYVAEIDKLKKEIGDLRAQQKVVIEDDKS